MTLLPRRSVDAGSGDGFMRSQIEQQLRRYKEKVQNNKGDVTHGGSSPRSFEHPPAPVETPTDPDDV